MREKVCSIKDTMLNLIETQISSNLKNVDAEELGEVADIAKDMAEIMKLCSEAEYFEKITDAMDESSRYIDNGSYRERMYYTPMDNGRSYASRKSYMNAKEHGDKEQRIEEMKIWASDFTEDVMEMLEDASIEEKAILKQHLTKLMSNV